MKTAEEVIKNKHLFYRLVALWAVCEGMLGGIIHGFNLPGTGLFISSAAVICIALIAWHYPVKGAILKATVIVAIVKMMLSPHSPPTAYIAVFFQGLIGGLLFSGKKNFRLVCLLLATLALVESAIQRILVMTIIYGNGLWKAIDAFITKLTGEKEITNYSWYIAIAYVLMHFTAGLIVGRFAGKLPGKLQWNETYENDPVAIEIRLKTKRKRKIVLLVTWIALLGLYIQSGYRIGTPLLPSSLPLQIIIRSLLVVFLWYFVISPLLSAWLKKWLEKKQYSFKDEVAAIVELIPSTQQLLHQSWRQTAGIRGIKRLGVFTKVALSRTVKPG
jgi:hypothetical protein